MISHLCGRKYAQLVASGQPNDVVEYKTSVHIQFMSQTKRKLFPFLISCEAIVALALGLSAGFGETSDAIAAAIILVITGPILLLPRRISAWFHKETELFQASSQEWKKTELKPTTFRWTFGFSPVNDWPVEPNSSSLQGRSPDFLEIIGVVQHIHSKYASRCLAQEQHLQSPGPCSVVTLFFVAFSLVGAAIMAITSLCLRLGEGPEWAGVLFGAVFGIAIAPFVVRGQNLLVRATILDRLDGVIQPTSRCSEAEPPQYIWHNASSV